MRPAKIGSRRLRTFELLEARQVLSATLGSEITPQLTMVPAATSTSPSGYTPAQIRAAYGFNNITFGSVVGNGANQTIAIVDAYNDPNILSDLAKFDAQFGIAAPPNIKVVNQNGGTTLPANDRGWASEIALDVEWAHAIAPGANILLVEASSASTSALNTALDYARNASGVVVVSNSWGGSEYSTESSSDVHFTTPAGHAGVTFTVAAGDDGAPAEYPSSSPDVLSVGGTTLRLTSTGTWSSETVWSDGGGGSSRYEGLPSFQSGLGITNRGTPDVSYGGNPSTGFSVYDSYGSGGWAVYGGTSVGAPQWAALIAIADQGRTIAGKSSLSNAQAALYTLPRSDFHDITSGSNGNTAASGYDLASGLGSPISNLVVRDLVAYSGATSFTVVAAKATVNPRYPWWWWYSGAFNESAGGGAAAAPSAGGEAFASDSPAAAVTVRANAISDSAAAQSVALELRDALPYVADNSQRTSTLSHDGSRGTSESSGAGYVALDAFFASLEGAKFANPLLNVA